MIGKQTYHHPLYIWASGGDEATQYLAIPIVSISVFDNPIYAWRQKVKERVPDRLKHFGHVVGFPGLLPR